MTVGGVHALAGDTQIIRPYGAVSSDCGGRALFRALARDPRASLCVDLEEPPYAFVQVQGEAELSENPAELIRTATAIADRKSVV